MKVLKMRSDSERNPLDLDYYGIWLWIKHVRFSTKSTIEFSRTLCAMILRAMAEGQQMALIIILIFSI